MKALNFILILCCLGMAVPHPPRPPKLKRHAPRLQSPKGAELEASLVKVSSLELAESPARKFFLVWDYPPHGTNIVFDVFQSFNITGPWTNLYATTADQIVLMTTTNPWCFFRVKARDTNTGLESK